MPVARLDPKTLTPLFCPASVAVIGASADPTKLGSIPIGHMKASGFVGPLYPINPKAATVQDLPAFPNIGAVPGPVDLAIIAVPDAHVLSAMRDCAAKGVRAVVLFTSGFAEVSQAGRRAQEEIKSIARDAGIRLLGPNCMGLVNFANGVVATFHTAFGPGLAAKGRIGLVSQSGAFGGIAYQIAQDRKLAYSLIVTTGNEGDVDVADGIAYLADDPDTSVILLYVEGCGDEAKLAEALALARARKKPVICLKVGRTEAGIAAVASHTAALAGTDEIFDAMFRQHGVYRASTMEEFFDIGYAAAQVSELPRDNRIGIVTVSGGVGILMTDTAAARGLDVAQAPQSLQDAIRAMVPFAGTRNPIDVTGQVVSDIGILDRTIERAIAEGGYSSIACFIGSVGRSPVNAPRFMEVFARLRQRYPGTVLSVSTLHTPAFRAALDAAGCLLFDEPTHAVRAVAALAQFRRAFDAPPSASPAPRPAEKLPRGTPVMAESPMSPFHEMKGKSPEEAKFFWSGGPIEAAPRTWFQSYLSGVTAFETDEGLVLVDSGLGQLGPKLAGLLRQKTSAPVHTAIFTQGHVDHAFGLKAFLVPGQKRPRVIAHAAMPARFARYELTSRFNAAINARQFGGSVSRAESGEFDSFHAPELGPDTLYDQSISITVGGVAFEVNHCRGETDDHTWVWCPERRVLCPGDLFIWSTPNAGNPQKVQRYPWDWAAGLRRMAALDPASLCPGHGAPVVSDPAKIHRMLIETADYLDSLVAQTIAALNDGAPPHVDIVHRVKPPKSDSPWLQPVYDEAEFIVRNIIRYYAGWWAGRPSDLKPASRAAVAREMATLAGGPAALVARAEDLAKAGDTRLACHMADYALEAAPRDAAVQEAVAALYEWRARQETSLMARNLFRSAAAYAREGRSFL